MNNKDKRSRKYSWKALNKIDEIKNKYPNGISDVSKIGSEARALIEKKIQQARECLKKVNFKSKPDWWEMLRLTRNKTAHQTDDSTDEEFADLCNKIFSNIDKISDDLHDNIERYKQMSKKKRKFENTASPSFGSENDRKQLVDAMEEMISPEEPKDAKIEFPENKLAQTAEKVLSDILSHDDIREYVNTHEGLSENIQTDILEWLQKTNDTLEKENPFFDEAVFVEEKKKVQAEDVALDLSSEKSKIRYNYKRLPSVSESKRGSIAPSTLDFDFYAKEFESQKEKKKKDEKEEHAKWKSAEKIEALRRNFIADMENNLIDRKNKWEQERIDEFRKKFLEDLYKKIQNFINIEKLLSPFIKDFGRLWDLSAGMFETSGFEILERFAVLLEQDKSLQELAELLGKQSRTQSLFEKELRDRIVVKTDWHPKSDYRGEINGVRYSNDIASVLPSELALMKNPRTKKLFQLKLAQKQLLSFEYQNYAEISNETTEQEEASVEKKDHKGPIIICVDTSGSMHGTPENIAKTITFALSKIAIEEERKCYLISFSTGIETVQLDMTDDDGNALDRLVKFLTMSFHGGTYADPALKHAVKMLGENDWKNADVLMISDGVMPNINDDMQNLIKSEQDKNTEFYFLTIGSSANQKVIDCFDHNWLYDMSDPKASRHLVEQLDKLKKR